MDIAEALEFVRNNHDAILATFPPGGGVQMTPITVGVDDDGRLEISTRQDAYKTRHIRRDPRVSLVVVNPKFYGPWVRVDGTATIVELPEALEGLVEYYRRIRGEHPDWDEYRQAMRDQKRVLLQVTVERVGPNVAG